MVKTPGTCRRISVLWTKHSSTNKFDSSETTATTTMNKAKMISAKSMSHSGKSAVGLPAPVVDGERLKSTMVTRRSSLQRINLNLNPRVSARAAVLSNFPRALSSVLNPSSSSSSRQHHHHHLSLPPPPPPPSQSYRLFPH